MKIVLIGNVANGIGLERDATLLSAFLVSRGHTVATQQYDQPATASGFDLGIFLETMSEHLVPIAARHWIIINPEWFKPESLRPAQRHCELVLAKTRDAEQLLRSLFPRVVFTGFLTTDIRDCSIQRIPSALHVGGNSGYRGTSQVVAAWRDYRYWDQTPLPPLTVVSNSRTFEVPTDVPGITFIKRAEDADLRRLQNECLYHILPSAYEGWGHALHEAQSVGAILLTTQAVPMTDLCAPFEVPPTRTRKAHLATLSEVTPEGIRVALSRMLTLPNYEIARMQMESRLRFERDNADFPRRMDALLAGSEGAEICVSTRDRSEDSGASRLSPPARPLRIAILGNFGPPHSTENDLAWTLSDMGHTVLKYQENEDSTEEILSGCAGAQLLIYVSTHGWRTPGRMTIDELIERLRDNGVKTVSFHLDKYWGLNRLDQRQDRVGRSAFWKTDYVFTADGGHAREFKDRGVNHRWLPPGVVKRDCYFGEPRPDHIVDVGFVGAEGYHPEYPFRGELLSFLRACYGDRFRVFTGYRGQALNDLYASIRVVVGDSCFGGSDYYWSDRVPETLGRFGYLIHPATRGLDIPGLVTFPAGDLHALQDRIDWSLAHDSFRKHSRHVAQEWVTAHETYHNRMATLLREVGL